MRRPQNGDADWTSTRPCERESPDRVLDPVVRALRCHAFAMRTPIASEPFEHSGVWWLPSASAAHDLAVAEDGAPQDPAWLGHGVLTYDPGIALKLTLT